MEKNFANKKENTANVIRNGQDELQANEVKYARCTSCWRDSQLTADNKLLIYKQILKKVFPN